MDDFLVGSINIHFYCILLDCFFFPFSMVHVLPQVSKDNPINLKKKTIHYPSHWCRNRINVLPNWWWILNWMKSQKPNIENQWSIQCDWMKWANGKKVIANHEGNLINKLTIGRRAIASLQWKWPSIVDLFQSFSKWIVSMSLWVGGSNSIFLIIICVFHGFSIWRCKNQPSASNNHYCIDAFIPKFQTSFSHIIASQRWIK